MGARPSVLVAAEVKRTEAEAEATRTKAVAEAEATRTKSVAEAEAMRTKSVAETMRATAEAEATRTKSVAEAEATRTKAAAEAEAARSASYHALAPLALFVLAGGSLAADWYFHESVPHIKRRMMAMLRTRGVAETKPEWSVQVKQAPLTLGQLPVMVLGPTGCGKSTLLDGVLRDARATGTPSLLLHWRRQHGRDGLEDAALSVNAKADLEAAAQHVFPQIGFPTRRSFVGSLLTNGVWAKIFGIETKLPAPTADRLAFAMKLLFEVSQTMFSKRLSQGMSRELARPVLMFDEVQDLVRDERLALMGGRLVFDQLASLLVTYGVDRGVVRTVAAGSSAMLAIEFNKTVANDFRWDNYLVTDPDEGDVLEALQRRGYTEQEAASMVELCGTRLRLLQGPLTKGVAALKASVFLADTRAKAQLAFKSAFSLLSTPAAKQNFAAVLDSIEQCKQHVNVNPPSLEHLPPGHSANDFSRLIYVNPDGSLTFQSQLHRRVWATIRETILV
jgi:energy-coupling factor transporter ATP-binding protein EcfA2